MGLIANILGATPPKKVIGEKYRMNPKLLKSKSDIEAFQAMTVIAEKRKAGLPISKEDWKSYRRAIKVLTDRGIMAQMTEED